jgi:hypothetical protein
MEMFCVRWKHGEHSDFCLTKEELDNVLSDFESPDHYTVSTLTFDMSPQGVRDLLFRHLITDRTSIEPTGGVLTTQVFHGEEGDSNRWFELFLIRDPDTFEYVDIWIDRREIDKTFVDFENRYDTRAKDIWVELTPEGVKDLFHYVLVVGD